MKLILFDDLNKESLPIYNDSVPFIGNGIWYNTTSKNDSVFVYNSNDLDVDFYGDSINFDLNSIEYHREDHIRLMGQQHYKKLDEGWLIGSNKGEWGGSLFWVAENLKEYKNLGNANVNKIFNWEDKIFFLEGVSHLNLSEGHLIEIQKDLKLDTLVTFPESPYNSVVSPDGFLYVITDFKLFKVDKTGNYSQLYDFSYWPQLNNDLTYDNDQLYIGMLHGVARFNLNENKIEWFSIKKE